MKTKRFAKKLTLNKKTVANLNNSQLGKIYGGLSGMATCTCPSRIDTKCPEKCPTADKTIDMSDSCTFTNPCNTCGC